METLGMLQEYLQASGIYTTVLRTTRGVYLSYDTRSVDLNREALENILHLLKVMEDFRQYSVILCNQETCYEELKPIIGTNYYLLIYIGC